MATATATAPKAKKAQSLVVDFDFEKETPGTLRFKEVEPEDGSRPAIGTLYITKKALVALEGQTTSIRVTVEAIG